MTTKKVSNPIPYAARLKTIRDRLSRARQITRFTRCAEIPKPAKVLAAEKVLAEWERRNDAASDAFREKHQAKVREIEDALILGDGEKLVKLLAAIGA